MNPYRQPKSSGLWVWAIVILVGGAILLTVSWDQISDIAEFTKDETSHNARQTLREWEDVSKPVLHSRKPEFNSNQRSNRYKPQKFSHGEFIDFSAVEKTVKEKCFKDAEDSYQAPEIATTTKQNGQNDQSNLLHSLTTKAFEWNAILCYIKWHISVHDKPEVVAKPPTMKKVYCYSLSGAAFSNTLFWSFVVVLYCSHNAFRFRRLSLPIHTEGCYGAAGCHMRALEHFLIPRAFL